MHCLSQKYESLKVIQDFNDLNINPRFYIMTITGETSNVVSRTCISLTLLPKKLKGRYLSHNYELY